MQRAKHAAQFLTGAGFELLNRGLNRWSAQHANRITRKCLKQGLELRELADFDVISTYGGDAFRCR